MPLSRNRHVGNHARAPSPLRLLPFVRFSDPCGRRGDPARSAVAEGTPGGHRQQMMTSSDRPMEGEGVFENHSFGSRMGSLLLFGLVIGIVVALVVGVAGPMLDAADQVGTAGG